MSDHAFVPAPPTSSTLESAPAPGPAPRSPVPPASTSPMTSASAVIVVRGWPDTSLADRGHDPRSIYVERFWLGVLGPSATWLLRRLTDELEQNGAAPVRVDLAAIARQMGMSYRPGRSSAFSKAIQRCVMFGIAHHTGDGLAIRTRIPTVADRHLRRLPPDVVAAHHRWLDHETEPDQLHRARQVARALATTGDGIDQIEHSLRILGVGPATAGRIAADTCRSAI